MADGPTRTAERLVPEEEAAGFDAVRRGVAERPRPFSDGLVPDSSRFATQIRRDVGDERQQLKLATDAALPF